MRRAYKFRLYPTRRQQAALAAMLDDHRDMYNAALQERRDAYRQARVTVRYGDQSAQLKQIRRELPDQARWSFSSQQATLRRLNRAFDAFFRRVTSGQTPGFPRFKGKGWFDTVEWPKDGDGCRWDCTPDDRPRVRLQGIGHIKVNQHRPVEGVVKTLSVKREQHRWFIVVSCDNVPAGPLEQTGAVTGIDMGVESFLTTSEAEHVPNPRHLAASADKLAKAQQDLARKKRGSNRRRKARAHLAAIHDKVRRQRLDFAHKTARNLIDRHDLISHEALRINNMTRSARGTVDEPGHRVAQKAGLNRNILDAGWGVFLNVLHAKAESAGRVVVAVNPRNTSRTCHRCGHCSADNRITQAEFRCVSCRHTAHADVNAAENILGAGLALHAAQAA